MNDTNNAAARACGLVIADIRRATASMLVLIAAMLVLAGFFPLLALAQTETPPAPTSLIVKLVPGLTADEQAAVIARYGGTEISSVPALRLHVVEVAADKLDAALAAYQADTQVARAEINKVRQVNAVPSDAQYPSQWFLPRIGWDQVFGTPANAGANVVVAILDTGIDAAHADLIGNVVAGTSIFDGSSGMSDPSGHGTMVAGTVAANTDNGVGIAGVAYAGVRMMPVTVLNADGIGQDSDIINGVVWAADHGARVILMAFSNPGFSASLQEAIDYAWSKNVVLVAANGNDGANAPTFPAGDRGVIGVSATDESDTLAAFSNYGSSVFLAAPGTNILTTDNADTKYIAISGTSSAAAIVAGAAAQMIALDPTLSNGVVVGRLARNADPAGTQEQTGNGRINFARAVADTGMDFVQPAGAAPVGGGGPFVGPYVAATTTTTTTLTSTPNPSALGQSITFTATVTCTGACTYATGSTVDFKDGANNGCNGQGVTTLATIGTLTGSGLTRQATFTTSSLSAGVHSIRACFNGSGGQGIAGTSSSNPYNQTVNGVAATTLTVSSASGTYAGTVALSATLTSGGTGVSNKTVTFTLNGGSVGSVTTNGSGIATLSGVSLSGVNVGTYANYVGTTFAGDSSYSGSNASAQLVVTQASSTTVVTCNPSTVTYSGAPQTPCTVNVTGAGGLNLTPPANYSNNTDAGTAAASYTYAGDTNYTGSNGSSNFTIGKANTATTVTSSGNPSAAGSEVTFTANVSSADLISGTVPGAVQFVVDGVNVGSPVTLTNGQAVFSTSDLTQAKLYSVTAHYVAATNFNGSSGALQDGQTVDPGALDHLLLNPATGTISAGGSQSYTAEGFDAFGNSRGDVTAATTFSITGGSCANASCTATVAGDQTVTGTNGGKTGTATLTVVPGALKTFLVEASEGGAIQPQTAGTPFNVRITARDQFNNTVTGFSGTVTITSSGTLVGSPITSGTFVNGVLATQSVSITSAQSGTILTAIGGGGNGTSNGFTVNAAGVHTFLVEAEGGNNIGAQTAGAPFNIWITARDQFNNVVVNFAGGVTLSSNAAPSTQVTATFTGSESGILAVNGVVLTLAGQNKSISVTDGFNSGTSNDFTVNPGGVANFLVEKAGGGDIEPQTAHTPFDIWITARDAFNNIVVDFTGTVTLSTNAGVIAPTTVDFVPSSDSGVHQASVTVTQAGTNKQITASFDADAGTSNPFTVNKASAKVTLDVATLSQTYDGTGRVVTATTEPSGLAVKITYAASSTPPVNVGTYSVVAAIDDEGYEGSADGTLVVSKRPITVTADAKTKVYGDADPVLSYHVTSGSLVSGDNFTGELTRVTGEGVGAYAIQQGTLALTDNYMLTYVGANLGITARPITVTADAKTKIYGEAEPALTYHITGGSLVSGDNFTGALTRVTGESVGTYAIQQGTLALGTNYALTYKPADLTITARPLTVTADARTKVYGDAEPTLTYQVTAGSLVNGDAFTGALTRVAGESVGKYAIQQGTLSAGGNYALTFKSADLTITARPITVTADAKTKVYGEPDPALTYQVTSGSLVPGDSFTGALTRAPGESVGAYAIQQGTLALNANYLLVYVTAQFSITARPITVSADAKSKVYGDADPAFTYHITNGSLVAGDNMSGALTRVAGESVGTYTIQQGTLSLGTNYALTYKPADLSITARPITVTADAKSKVYGDGDPSLTYQITGSLVLGDSINGTLTRVAGESVGMYKIQQGSLELSTNYILTFVPANLTITARPITVSADAKSKIYGNVDPALTYHVTSGSLVGSDALTGALTRVSGENVGIYAIQQGTLALSNNYSLAFVGANLSITARPITVTADVKAKVYGDGDPVLTYQISSGSLAFNDTFSGALSRVAGESVGTYSIQQGSLALSGNYSLGYVGATLTITKRALTVTADDKTKIAGGVNPPLTGLIVGIQFNDNITASFSTTAVTSSPPGNYPITPVLIDAANKLGNYDVTIVGGTLTATPNALPVLGAITVSPSTLLPLGTQVTISVPFTDADVAESQPYTATIDWGDQTTSTSSFSDVGTITGTKKYASAGVYIVTVTVRQDNFDDHYASKTMDGYMVVYDASAGFVTGGGWINSPMGASITYPNATGKANFGFNSKYQKGANVPSGDTQFQFQAGNLDFKSKAYEWLVISGARAQYKGTGTINGTGNYGFILTAIDGSVSGGGGTDRFRIKIWDNTITTGNNVVYDNQMGSDDTSALANPGTALGGGSIVIHK